MRLLPSDRVFQTNPEESILLCALRAGLSLPFGCTRGTCGDCRARVLQGEHKRCGHHDYSLTAAEKAVGTVLLCRTAACSDLAIEAGIARGVDDLPKQAVPVKLTGTRRLSAAITEVSFKVQRGKVFRFLAGQRAVLKSESLETGALPIASCPCDGSVVRFVLPTECSDPLLGPIVVQAGDDTSRLRPQRLTLEGPQGNFVLSENSPNPIVFVCHDEGFGAVSSLLEHALNLELEQPINVLRLASDAGHFFAHNFCRSLADAYDNVTYWHQVLSEMPPHSAARYGQFVGEVIVRLADAAEPFVYVAGGEAFCDAVRDGLERSPIQVGRISSDTMLDVR